MYKCSDFFGKGMPMRTIPSLLLLICLIAKPSITRAHEQPDSLSLLVSGAYTINIPINLLRGSTIANVDDLMVRLNDGGSFMAKVITHEMDGLPKNFDMHLYPEYCFGLKQPSDLDAEITQRFINSNRATMRRFRNSTPSKRRTEKYWIYEVSYERDAIFFIVPTEKTNHVLLMDFGETDRQTINTILGGIK